MKNLILIHGNEEYLKEKKKQELLRELCAEGSINFNSFSSENLDLIEIKRLIDTMPFMEQYRKILITDSGLFKKTGKAQTDEELEIGAEDGSSEFANDVKKSAAVGEDADSYSSERAYTEAKQAAGAADADVLETFSDIPESTVVIFVEGNVSAQKPLYKLIKKDGEVFKYETVDTVKGSSAVRRQSEQNVRNWALDMFKKAGRKIDGSTLNYLVQLTGYNMENLSGEIEKLICYMLDKPKDERITTKHIDAICSRTLSDKVFAMLDAKLKGNIQGAVSMLEELFALKVAPMKTLYLLVRQYNQALSVKECQAARMSDAEIMTKLELKDWQLRRLKEQVSRISIEELEKRLEACADMEYKVKRGNMTDRLALELLIIQ